MRPLWILILLAALGGGLVVGLLVGGGGEQKEPPRPPEVLEDARAALDELLQMRKRGPRAARRSLVLVARVAAGGEALLEPLGKAVREARPWAYQPLHRSLDLQAGIISAFPTRKVALLDAVAQIGGDRAVEILKAASQDRKALHLNDRIVPLSFLAQYADRPDVRKFLTTHARTLIQMRRNDPEMIHSLEALRGRLDAGILPLLTGALALGWAQDSVAEKLAQAAYQIDPERAAAAFLATLQDTGDPGPPRTARKMAAWALARVPESRVAAAAHIVKATDRDLLFYFFKGIRHGRFGDVDSNKAAYNTGDPDAFDVHRGTKERDVKACSDLLTEIERELGPDRAKEFGIGKVKESIREDLEYIKKTLDELRADKNWFDEHGPALEK